MHYVTKKILTMSTISPAKPSVCTPHVQIEVHFTYIIFNKYSSYRKIYCSISSLEIHMYMRTS